MLNTQYLCIIALIVTSQTLGLMPRPIMCAACIPSVQTYSTPPSQGHWLSNSERRLISHSAKRTCLHMNSESIAAVKKEIGVAGKKFKKWSTQNWLIWVRLLLLLQRG